MSKIAVVLLSGGLDSSTVLAYAIKQGYELTALTLQYGQRHGKELASAAEVARKLGARHQTIDVSFFSELAWYSALTAGERAGLGLPKQREPAQMAGSIPATYVPLRNTFFIILAAALLESQALDLIERQKVDPANLQAAIFIAANAVDYSGYPDCRPEYFDSMEAALGLGSKLGAQYKNPIRIQTPIIDKTKADIVRMAVELGVPLEHTWSCYEGDDVPCGLCDSCLLRAKGFSEAGIEDPAIQIVLLPPSMGGS